MSQRLINRSPDLQQLQNDGYDIEIRSGYLLVNRVPYVNSNKEVKLGTLVSELKLAGDVTTAPDNHVVYFVGDCPCDKDGNPLNKIVNSSAQSNLAENLTISHTFSSKPVGGAYKDYYEKMTTYVAILCSPVQAIDPDATAQAYSTIAPDGSEDTPFKYVDTASSRARISAISDKLKLGKVGIVGLGGTGSYVLDLVAKTPVREIHLFDGDQFSQHNAFRSPGAPSLEDITRHQKKVHYFADQYSRMRLNIFPHADPIDETNVDQLREMNFIFLCLDNAPTRKFLVEKLPEFGIPYIDVGMGVLQDDGALGGILRITSSSDQKREHAKCRIPLADSDTGNEYSQNIQVADLNALSASLAVIKWKKLCGFYRDLENEYHSTYTIDGNIITNEDQL